MNDLQTINTLKGLVIDAVNKAKSGHPGGAMSSMDYAYLLFTEYLRFDPSNTKWLGRDRFILSAGHESMLDIAPPGWPDFALFTASITRPLSVLIVCKSFISSPR